MLKVFYQSVEIDQGMSLKIKKPILAIGLGGAGSRLVTKVGELLNCDQMMISNDVNDFVSSPKQDNNSAKMIKIDTGAVLNPTVNLVRTAAYNEIDQIREYISGYPTVILIGNLAGKAGCAISPVISKACNAEGANMISFAIMPFGYEKSQLFVAGVSLRRLRESSASTIVLDNDSLLESNPDLTQRECYDIADVAILYVLGSIDKSDLEIGDDSILVASRNREMLEESLQDALKTLYGSASPNTVKHSMLYVVGGENMPAGMLRTAAMLTEGVFTNSKRTRFDTSQYISANTRSVSAATGDKSRIVMLSTVQKMSKFEKYDPLGAIPNDKMLDWEDPECSIDCKLTDVYQLE